MKKLIIVWLVFSISIFSGCAKKEKNKKSQEATIPVSVIEVKRETILDTVSFVGDIRAFDEAKVFARAGGKVKEKLKQEGDFVKKGDILMYIDRDEIGFEYEISPVSSPLDGYIGRVYVDKADTVTTQTPLANIINIDAVKIKVNIPEKYLPFIAVGQSARLKVDAYPDKEFDARVSMVSPQLDVETRTFPAEATMDNKDYLLKPGMFAKMSLIIREHKEVPVILKDAIMGREPNCYVYVIENEKALLRNISLGIRQGPYYEVKEGLKEGELVVIMGQQRLYDGAQVNVEIRNSQ